MHINSDIQCHYFILGHASHWSCSGSCKNEVFFPNLSSGRQQGSRKMVAILGSLVTEKTWEKFWSINFWSKLWAGIIFLLKEDTWQYIKCTHVLLMACIHMSACWIKIATGKESQNRWNWSLSAQTQTLQFQQGPAGITSGCVYALSSHIVSRHYFLCKLPISVNL